MKCFLTGKVVVEQKPRRMEPPLEAGFSEDAYVLTALSGTSSCWVGAVRVRYRHGDRQDMMWTTVFQEVVYTSPCAHTHILMPVTLSPSTYTLLNCGKYCTHTPMPAVTCARSQAPPMTTGRSMASEELFKVNDKQTSPRLSLLMESCQDHADTLKRQHVQQRSSHMREENLSLLRRRMTLL